MTEQKKDRGEQSAPQTTGSTVVRTPAKQAAHYRGWTEEEKSAAKPRRLPSPSPHLPACPVGVAEEAEPRTFVPPRIGMPPYSSLCKVFYRNGGVGYVASAWIVEGPGGKGILTSGHVVYDNGQWSTDFLVLRQYSDGNYAEEFAGSVAFTLRGWIAGQGLKEFWDIGAIIPFEPIPASTPGLPAVFNYQPTASPFDYYYDAGYPAKPANGYPFDGRLLWESDGGLNRVFSQDQEVVLQAFNALQQGSSGSPWLVYDPLSERFFAAGMQSSGHDNVPLANSPWFCHSNLVVLLQDIGVL